jgi:hypothetical protein
LSSREKPRRSSEWVWCEEGERSCNATEP